MSDPRDEIDRLEQIRHQLDQVGRNAGRLTNRTGRWLVAEVERLHGEVERLRGLLARLEWAGSYREESICPVCEMEPGGGHDPGCWLAAELHGHQDTDAG
jgi:hypothetical protein